MPLHFPETGERTQFLNAMAAMERVRCLRRAAGDRIQSRLCPPAYAFFRAFSSHADWAMPHVVSCVPPRVRTMNAGAGAIPSADGRRSAEILPSAEARSCALRCIRTGTSTLQIRLRAAVPMYFECRPQPLICRPAENITAIMNHGRTLRRHRHLRYPDRLLLRGLDRRAPRAFVFHPGNAR